ncbi:hypothetical protein [Anatilimnocola floriformis]|uniref:hypothetical protein n=1 Tax=Anatilimnocola floriformis TaxID=2948575 RepID=UPI0020C40EE6|nr:hypothetical protein [Anatilimnocola floriformis]
MAWLIITLLLVNIPLYLLIGWLIFDSKETAADTFFGTILAILTIAFVPPIVRVMMGWNDNTEALGLFPIAAFFIACGVVTYGEYWLLTTYVFIPPV